MDCSWVGWCAMSHEAQAAWAQALLTVLTFAAAFWYQAAKSRRQEQRLEAERQQRAAEDLQQRQLHARAIAISFGKELRELLSAVSAASDTDVAMESRVRFLKERDSIFRELLPFATATPSLLHAAEPAQKLIVLAGVLHSLVKGVDPSRLTEDRAANIEDAMKQTLEAGNTLEPLITHMAVHGFD